MYTGYHVLSNSSSYCPTCSNVCSYTEYQLTNNRHKTSQIVWIFSYRWTRPNNKHIFHDLYPVSYHCTIEIDSITWKISLYLWKHPLNWVVYWYTRYVYWVFPIPRGYKNWMVLFMAFIMLEIDKLLQSLEIIAAHTLILYLCMNWQAYGYD